MVRSHRGKLTLFPSGMTTTTPSGKTRPLNLPEQIKKKARELWGDGVVVKIEQEKSKGAKALGAKAPNGWVAVRVVINGRATGIALHPDKTQALKSALAEVEKLYERTLKEAP